MSDTADTRSPGQITSRMPSPLRWIAQPGIAGGTLDTLPADLLLRLRTTNATRRSR